uniref:Receptor-like serine/threonine-protein kinase n=1 Tax=Oryza nivara TaxID=4536 RepID=A0A0E0GP68_ORYNI
MCSTTGEVTAAASAPRGLLAGAAGARRLSVPAATSPLSPDNDVLQSADGTFSCGFLTIYSNAFAFSIWYTNSKNKTVVWTANRGRPVHARRSVVTLQKDGAMVLKDYDGTVVWQSDSNSIDVQYAQLLDTGNLVMKNSSDPDRGEYGNKRNRYNNTRMGFLDDNGDFVSSDFADQQPFSASDKGSGIKRRLTLDHDGNLRLYSLSNGEWLVSWVAISQPCNIHGLCGPNGICHYSPTPTCSCPPGYEMNSHGFQYLKGEGTCFPKSFLFNGRAYPSHFVSPRSMYLKIPISMNISGMPVSQSNVLDSRKHSLNCDQMDEKTRELFPDVHKTSQGETRWFYLCGFAGAIFILEVFFIGFAWFFVSRWDLDALEIQAVEQGYKVMASNFRRYNYKELAKATRKFKCELGRGGSGIVYKGTLDDGRVVAVKMLENVRQCEEEFQAELRIIGKINHMNLVRIWGFCSENSHRMLVTEYIENGSLANILFNENILLEWRQRFNIAVGVAKGLAYLHHECLEWVIHCDVKPENILLDGNFEPKIADFGLAKLLNRGGSNQNVSRVRGTIGYIAPEWISSLQITAKVDVYSYGVVLLELVSGKRVLDLATNANEEVHVVLRRLVNMFVNNLSGNEPSWIAEFVDCRLSGQFNYTQVRTMITLAVACLDEERSKRPTMESIVQLLLLVDESCSSNVLCPEMPTRWTTGHAKANASFCIHSL